MSVVRQGEHDAEPHPPSEVRIARTRPRPRLRPYLLLSLAACAFAGILELSGSRAFRPYLGSLSPVVATALVAAVGWVSLHALVSRGGFRVLREGEGLRGPLRGAVLATLLAGAIVLFDLRAVFPREINVSFPGSLLFYPTIALVAEVVFHVLPLSLLLLGVSLLGRARRWEEVVLYGLAVVALPEPLFQLGAPSAAALPSWGKVYLGVHLLVFNGLQLWIFRRHDFLSMYAFRLVYYGWWHVAWGAARLELLF